MAAIDNLINVTVSQQTQAVSTASFGIPLIVGKTSPDWDGDVVRAYSAPAALLGDGFTTESPEYLAAVAMYSGVTAPTTFCVGHRTSGSIAADLNNIFAQNNDAYGIVLTGLPDADILAAAAAVEGMKKLLIASSGSDDIAQSGTSDLASKLKAAAYSRTGLCFTKANQNGVLEAAWMGSQLPQTPGSNNWAYKTLPGVSVDSLTANQQTILYGVPVAGVQGKNVNVYESFGGANITFPGMAASGRYFDLTIGVDWLQAKLQEAIYSQLVNSPKIPYTDAGVSSLMNVINAVLRLAEANGLLDGNDPANPIYVRADSVDKVPVNQRAERIAPTLYFGGRLQGAISSCVISGVVTV